MSTRRATVIATALLALVALTSAPSAHAQAQDGAPSPTISVSLDAATVGQGVVVSGTSFPASTSVSLQLCGDEARNGSTDCDVVAGQTVVTDERGTFQGNIVVRFPPVPCPCVVWATSNGSAPASATAPIGVVSATYTPPVTPAAPATTTPQVVIVRSVAHQRSAWRGWFGLPSRVDVEVTVRNDGSSTVQDPVLSMTVGKSDDPIRVVSSPAMSPLAPGEERTIVVPVDLGALSYGRYTVKGSFGASDVAFRVHTSVVPWAGLLILVAAVALLWRRRVIRRRRRAAALEVAVTTELSPEPSPIATGAASIPRPRAPVMPAVAGGTTHLVRVTFSLPSWTTAETVALCSDFNDWDPHAHALRRDADGRWQIVVALKGDWSYRYRFLLDGNRWENDWTPDAFVDNAYGSRDSVVVVGQSDRYADSSALIDRATLPEPPTDDEDFTMSDDLESTFEGFWSEETDAIRTKVRRWLK